MMPRKYSPASSYARAGMLVLLLSWPSVSARAQADDELDALGEQTGSPTPADEQSGEPAPDAADSGKEAAPPAHARPAAQAAAAATSQIEIQPFVGVGMTTRAFERPTAVGAQRLDTVIAPAVEIGLNLALWPKASFSLNVLLQYQSAVGLTLHELPPFALENDVNVRSERVELSFAPAWRLGSSARAPHVSVPIGGVIRTFFPDVHNLMTPRYSLIGVLARIEANLPLASLLSLQLGPEVQVTLATDDSLVREGVSSQGVAFGGRAGLVLALGEIWSLGLHYRESHALASSTGRTSFSDVERYITLRAQGTF